MISLLTTLLIGAVVLGSILGTRSKLTSTIPGKLLHLVNRNRERSIMLEKSRLNGLHINSIPEGSKHFVNECLKLLN